MASSSEPIEKTLLHDWVEGETRQIDLVASWESLCETYRMLEFTDPITDAMRMEEFKWIVSEMNKHLTRARRTLLSCRDRDAMEKVLSGMFSTATTVTCRRELAYHKLRQRWVSQMLARLDLVAETMEEKEDEVGGADW